MRFSRSVVIIALFVFTNAFAIGERGATEGKTEIQIPERSTAEAISAVASGDRDRFVGTYRYGGSAQEEEARRSAIDRAAESAFFAIRSTVRSRISAVTQIPDSYSFSFEPGSPGKIHVKASSRPEMISSDNGEPADYVYNGTQNKLTQQFAGDRISQVFVSESGRRENEFTFSQDGQVLTLKVTLSSPRISKPVVYVLTYKRAN